MRLRFGPHRFRTDVARKSQTRSRESVMEADLSGNLEAGPLPSRPRRVESGGSVQKGLSMRSVRNAPLPVLLILLTLTLAASPALATGGRDQRPERTPGLFATVWQALGELVSWPGVTRAGKSGSVMDPNGETTSACLTPGLTSGRAFLLGRSCQANLRMTLA